MSEDISIWMPITWADYWKDTKHLTQAQHGAYMHLMRVYWDNKGPIESDLSAIYRATSAINPDDQENVRYILSKFFREKDEFFSQKRMDLEIAKARKNKRARSKAGRASGVARRTNVQQMNEQKGQQNGIPSPSSSPSPKDDGIKDKEISEPIHKTSHLEAARGDVLKKGFDIRFLLTDAELTKAKQVKPEWDFYEYLVPTYNKFINSGAGTIPDNPYAAFIGWIKKYFKNTSQERNYG